MIPNRATNCCNESYNRQNLKSWVYLDVDHETERKRPHYDRILGKVADLCEAGKDQMLIQQLNAVDF